MNALSISPEAKKDLEDIKAYIAETLCNPPAAIATVTKIVAGMKRLRDMPFAGSGLASKVSFDTDYRYVICGNYLAFYRYKDKTVFVDRVLYGKRDYLKTLFPEYSQGDFLDDEEE